jgi:hypothetical protein
MPSLLISAIKNGLLLARAIINLNKEEIPLRIVNVNDTPCTIYKGTIVATCELIKETNIQENKDVNTTNPTRSLLIRSINWPLAIISVFGGT